MSNPNAPFGFKAIRSQSGGAHISSKNYQYASNATRIGKGDLVVLTSAGQVKKETSATAVGPWIGVSLIDTGVIAAVGTVPVCDDPNAIFEVMSTAALAQTDLNRIVQVNGSGVANANTGLSSAKLTNTAATASNGVRILNLANRPGNAFGANQVLEVCLNSRVSQSAGV